MRASLLRAVLLWTALTCTACTPSEPDTADAGTSTDASLEDAAAASPDGAPPDAGANDAGARDAGARGSDAGADAGADAGTDAGPPEPSFDDRVSALNDPSASPGDLDALIHEIAWTEGWPLTDGRRWLFATRWDDAPAAVSLVSDVNEWEPAPARRAVSGVHFWIVIEQSTFAAPAAGAKYKWHGAPDVFRAPPESTAYGFDTFGEFGYVAPPGAFDAPGAERYRERFPDFRSAHLGPPRAFRAYLPAGHSPGDAARVLLLHDGQNIFHPDAFFGGWRVDEAIAAPGYEDVVVLAIDNASDRMHAYTQVPDDIGDGSPVGGRADDYGRLVFEEALPFFRARYGLRAGPTDLVVGGSSLGGLVSLHLAMTHDSEMHCVIAMSSTLGWGAFGPTADGMDALVRRWDRHGSVAVYLDSGGDGTCSDADGDGVFEDSDDSDNYCTTLQMRDHLEALGYGFGVDLFHQWQRGAGHNENAWASRIPDALSACVSAGWVRTPGGGGTP